MLPGNGFGNYALVCTCRSADLTCSTSASLRGATDATLVSRVHVAPSTSPHEHWTNPTPRPHSSGLSCISGPSQQLSGKHVTAFSRIGLQTSEFSSLHSSFNTMAAIVIEKDDIDATHLDVVPAESTPRSMPYSPAEEKTAVRKLDLNVIPMCVVQPSHCQTFATDLS